MLQFERKYLATLVQRLFHTNYGKKGILQSPFKSGINHMLKYSARRPSDEIVERVRASFLHSPQTPIRRASRELCDVSHTTL